MTLWSNDAADEAADFGRRRVDNTVIDVRRNLSGVCGRWYPIFWGLHRFFIAISGAVVDHDGGTGTAPDSLVWSAGARPKRLWLVHVVGDHAMLLGEEIQNGAGLGEFGSISELNHWHLTELQNSR